MGQRKNKIPPLLVPIIAAVIIIVLGIIPIPQNARSVATNVLVGIFVSGGIIGWKPENKRNTIIAHIILWGAIIAAIVIILI